MSAEKTEVLVVRQADFSESSRVVTLFSREHGKLSCVAKGAKRLRSAFESALDLLARCHVVFLRKSSGALHLLTEARLIRRFHPPARSLNHLYGGYYVAELLDAMTEADDPHPELFDCAVDCLAALTVPETSLPSDPLPDPRIPILQFELAILRETGLLPDFDHCSLCGEPLMTEGPGRFWLSQGEMICTDCERPELEHTDVSKGALAVVRRLAVGGQDPFIQRLVLTSQQGQELRRFLTTIMCYALGKRPKMLGYLNFR